MAPPPLATAAAAEDTAELLEVRCVGCSETLEVERGLTEFVCPDCATPQSLPPELMPPPRRRALPLPRGAADARGARLPCGACGELLSVLGPIALRLPFPRRRAGRRLCRPISISYDPRASRLSALGHPRAARWVHPRTVHVRPMSARRTGDQTDKIRVRLGHPVGVALTAWGQAEFVKTCTQTPFMYLS